MSLERPIGEAANGGPRPDDKCTREQINETVDSVDYRGRRVGMVCRFNSHLGFFQWQIYVHYSSEKPPKCEFELDCAKGAIQKDWPDCTCEPIDKVCLECKEGYDLVNGKCVKEEAACTISTECKEKIVASTVNEWGVHVCPDNTYFISQWGDGERLACHIRECKTVEECYETF